MGGNVPCNQFNAVGCAVDSALLGKLSFQVRALGVAQVGRYFFKPAINCFLIDVQLWHSFLIQQWSNSFIFHRTLHGVGMNDRTKLVGGLLVFKQGCTSEGDVGRVG